LDNLVQTISGVATGETPTKPYRIQNEPPELKRAIDQLVEKLESAYPNLPNSRWVALRLLDGDERISEAIYKGELGDLTRGEPEVVSQGLEIELETAR
jgi:ferrous iron transport protein B